jgi:hypothetical protein
MPVSPDDIGQFFTAYAGAFNRALGGDADLKVIADHFTDCFIESSPAGVICASNGGEFLKVLEKGYAYYRSIGTKEMSVTGVDSYPICHDHSVATVHWRAAYAPKDKGEIAIDFDVHYLVKKVPGTQASALKIFGFIAGDEQGALRKAGVI